MNGKIYYLLLFVGGICIGAGSTILATNISSENKDCSLEDVDDGESVDPEEDVDISSGDSSVKIYRSSRNKRPYHDYTSCFPTTDEVSKWAEGRARADFEDHMAEREYPEDDDEEGEMDLNEMTSIDRHSEMEINGFDPDHGKITDTGPDTFTIHFENIGEAYAIADLVYTIVDGYLTDAEDHSVYDDPVRIIGDASIEDLTDSFCVDHNDETHIFIRNTRLKTDFDILVFVGTRDDYLDALATPPSPTMN